MTKRSVAHATFTIERSYRASPARVFGAWADAEARQAWMGDPDFKTDGAVPYELDFRIGGHERFGGTAPDGRPHRYEALIYDIIEGERIVYSYEMYMGAERISVSLATVQITGEAGGSRLTYTEQGAFLDGLDKPDLRAEGMGLLLGSLGEYLAGHEAG